MLPSHESGLLCLCFYGVNQMCKFRVVLCNSNVLGILYLLGMRSTLKLLEINKLFILLHWLTARYKLNRVWMEISCNTLKKAWKWQKRKGNKKGGTYVQICCYSVENTKWKQVWKWPRIHSYVCKTKTSLLTLTQKDVQLSDRWWKTW